MLQYSLNHCKPQHAKDFTSFKTLAEEYPLYSQKEKPLTMKENTETKENPNESLPSFFKNWNQAYAVVIGELAALIVLFYAFTKMFS